MMDGELEPKPGLVEGSTTPAPEEEPMDTDTTRSSEKTTPPTGSQAPVTTVTEEPSRVPENNDNDDDVVLVEEAPSPSGKQPPTPSATPPFHAGTPADCTEPRPSETETTATVNMTTATAAAAPFKKNSPPATSSAPSTEPIVIDDEEDPGHRGSSLLATAGGPSSSYSGGILSSTEPDSEIKIGNVTTLGPSAVATAATAAEPVAEPERDMNLMITSVTSLQGGVGVGGSDVAEKGLQISSTFSLNPEARSSISTTRLPATFNPGRVSNTSTTSQPVQNGDTGTHQRPDSWISQSASFPRNQKQTGVDSPSPTASLPKPPGPSPSGSQNPPRTVKVTCANCKKPLKKGQTAYQRKGSTHLFCSTTCLSAFSHKPTPKKSCTMCKKDITTMKGTIVAQVDSSESFQEFCSTGCLGAYENKQNPPKSSLKTKCTVCGKLTEIRHEVSFKTVTHKICSDACFNRYRMANGLIVNCCEQCGEYLPSRATANHFLIIDGKQKRFCCQNCMQDYKQPHSKMTMCTGCSAMVRSSEVTHCIGASGTMEPYCSTACMNKTKIASTTTTVLDSEPTCHFCKKTSLPQYQATLLEGNVLNFCSSTCVTKFQNTNIQTVTNGQTPLSTTNHNIQLKCNYCRGAFSLKPETLEWEDKVYQFCSKICCEDYKKLHCIVTFCEYCQEEKTLHETVKFSGVKRPFCSEGCKLLFKQDFAKRLGLKCVTCNYCTQLCKRGVTRQLAGVSRDFCSETCAKKFHEWYYKAARCDCCKVQGNLTESVQWRAEMKHFCDQQCLLRFYCQQNEPNLATQKGPENTRLGFGIQTEATNIAMLSQPYTGGGILKDVKNKAVLCKPLTMTKATYCKPHMQSKLLQTDEDDWVKREYIPVPIPVPVFIPVPMNLYAQITPIPITLPVPVPVPVFLPTTLQGTEQIVQTMNKLKAKVPTDPHEADLSMAEMIAEDQKPDVKVKRERGEGEARSSSSSSSNSSSESEAEEEKYEPDLDLENDFPQDPFPTLESLDVDMGFTLPPLLAEEKDEVPRARRQGHKRRAVEGDPSPPMTERRSLPLRSHYGVNAWKRWALSSTDQSGDAKGKDSLKQESPPARSKSNLLSLKASELSLALSRFVREVRRPNGERYAPDSILYLCLGIQQHLQAKGRKDELFSDSCFEPFGEELNKVLKDWQPSVMPDGARWGCVEEQCLWSCKLLGEQSPAALLRSLVYLNTKYFGLRTVEQHLCLSFSNVYGPDHTDPATQETTVCIRVPSISSQDHPLQTGSRKRKRKEDSDPAYEPDDGSGSSSHCPVKKHEGRLYELYRSKCPGLLRQRMDVFYVQPEASGCSSDSDRSLWFSSTPLDRSVLESILTPLLLVKDIYRECHLEEEEEGGGE